MHYRNPQYESQYDFAAFPGSPCSTYMIASTPRSGSTLMACLCQQTGVLGFPAEYFAGINAEIMRKRLEVSDTGMGEYVAALMRVRTSPNGVFGFKLHYDQLSGWGFDQPGVLKRHFPALKAILLRRRDILGQAISFHIAAATNQWADIEGYQMAAAQPCQYDRPAIENAMRYLHSQQESWRRFLDGQAIPVLELDYEDLLRDVAQSFDTIGQYLGVKCVTPDLSAVGVRKQSGQLNQQYRELFLAEGYST